MSSRPASHPRRCADASLTAVLTVASIAVGATTTAGPAAAADSTQRPGPDLLYAAAPQASPAREHGYMGGIADPRFRCRDIQRCITRTLMPLTGPSSPSFLKTPARNVSSRPFGRCRQSR